MLDRAAVVFGKGLDNGVCGEWDEMKMSQRFVE